MSPSTIASLPYLPTEPYTESWYFKLKFF
jgi:hypothetical protein